MPELTRNNYVTEWSPSTGDDATIDEACGSIDHAAAMLTAADGLRSARPHLSRFGRRPVVPAGHVPEPIGSSPGEDSGVSAELAPELLGKDFGFGV